MCGRRDTKFYRSGFVTLVIGKHHKLLKVFSKPELCTAHLDIEERDLEWERNFQLASHYVYLANSSGIKVGITREFKVLFVGWIKEQVKLLF